MSTTEQEAMRRLGAGCKWRCEPSPGIPRPRPGSQWIPRGDARVGDFTRGMWVVCWHCAGTGVATKEKSEEE